MESPAPNSDAWRGSLHDNALVELLAKHNTTERRVAWQFARQRAIQVSHNYLLRKA